MNEHTKVPWTAIGNLVFKGSDCIGIFDTDNASEERYVANAHICALAVNSHEALVQALEEARYFFAEDFPDGPDGPCAVSKRYRAAYRSILTALAVGVFGQHAERSILTALAAANPKPGA